MTVFNSTVEDIKDELRKLNDNIVKLLKLKEKELESKNKKRHNK